MNGKFSLTIFMLFVINSIVKLLQSMCQRHQLLAQDDRNMVAALKSEQISVHFWIIPHTRLYNQDNGMLMY